MKNYKLTTEILQLNLSSTHMKLPVMLKLLLANIQRENAVITIICDPRNVEEKENSLKISSLIDPKFINLFIKEAQNLNPRFYTNI